jgi:HrpA-like RNA helicase
MKNIEEERRKLPITKAKHVIIDKIKTHETVILVGETGSGKTTQIPQYVYETMKRNPDREEKRICVTQPRRIAATSLAKRVAEEMNTKLGSKVGYTIRFDDCSSKDTRILYLTDGMLLRNVLNDPLLNDYAYVILDEAHERTLRTDILFGLVKNIQKMRRNTRNPLQIIVMSATMDAEKFSKFFDDAPILYVAGRQFPVDVYYSPEPIKDYVEAAVVTVFQIHKEMPSGDILVFLTGQEEIENVQTLIEENQDDVKGLKVCPIYASLPSHMQLLVFEKSIGQRKVILATNIAGKNGLLGLFRNVYYYSGDKIRR